MDKKQILKTGVHLIPAILTIALILGCASRPDLEKIPEKLEPAEEEIVMEAEEEQEVGEGDFDDGVYEGSAEGYGGPVKVKVTVEERQITDIEILDASKETDSFFSRAKAIVDDILRLQSWDVDVVSGATFSSNGIKGAVQNALTGKEVKTEKATKTSSGNSSALKKTNFTAPSGGYKDGTYTGSAQGFSGSIGVSVSISGGKITAVNIISASGETPSYLSSAKGVVSRILSKQTPNVDTVSGATYSSNGILNAIPDYSASSSTSVVLRLNSAELDENFIKMIVLEEDRLQKMMPVDALIVLSVLRSERRATIALLASKIQKSVSDARSVVEWLIELGMVEGVGNGSARRYMLSSKVYSITNSKAAYTRQRGWDTMQERELIFAHMDKYHEINRSGVVELCRCTPNHASWLLRQLTESGYLKRVGNGRGAKYHLAEKKL